MEEKIKYFVEKSQELLKKNKKEGKEFNIFNELGINTKEVKHSLMIKSLISPNGNHGMGTVFYDLFIEELNIATDNEWLKDYNNIKVYDEYFIESSNKEDLKNSYWGRIDLLIENRKAKKAIIIENKIYANDQPYQLIRYNNYAKDTYDKYVLVYLTLDGKKPSFQSYLGNNEGIFDETKSYQIKLNDIKRMSYSEHILNWLSKCLKVKNINNPVKYITEQYINIIKELTLKMEARNKELLLKEYKDLLKVITARDIIEVRDQIRKDFFIKLKQKLDSDSLIEETQFIQSIYQKVDDINTVLNSKGHVRNFGIAVTTKDGKNFNIEVQNYGDLIYGFFNNNKIGKNTYKQLEINGLWLSKTYKIDKVYPYTFYDDRLNYYLLTNMDFVVNDLIENILSNLEIK